MTTESRDIVKRLRNSRFIASSAGEFLDSSRLADEDGLPLSRLLDEAAALIESLRSLCGKADVGESFAEMTKDAKREVPYHEGAGGLPYRDA